MQLPIKENVVFKFTDIKLNKDSTCSSNNSTSNSTYQPESTKLLSQVKDCNALSDQSNPIIQHIVFFAKMFENFTKNDLKKTKDELEVEFNTKINTSAQSYQEYLANSLNEKKDFLTLENLKEIIYKTYSKTKDIAKNNSISEKRKMKKIMMLLVYLQMRKIEMKLNHFNEFEKIIQSETQQLKSMESQIIQDRIKLALKKSEILSLARKFNDLIYENQIQAEMVNNATKEDVKMEVNGDNIYTEKDFLNKKENEKLVELNNYAQEFVEDMIGKGEKKVNELEVKINNEFEEKILDLNE